MANKKKLQKAATKFRKENPAKHSFYSMLIGSMAEFITRSGVSEVPEVPEVPEVIVGFENGRYYEHANN